MQQLKEPSRGKVLTLTEYVFHMIFYYYSKSGNMSGHWLVQQSYSYSSPSSREGCLEALMGLKHMHPNKIHFWTCLQIAPCRTKQLNSLIAILRQEFRTIRCHLGLWFHKVPNKLGIQLQIVPSEWGIRFCVVPPIGGVEFCVVPLKLGIRFCMVPPKLGIWFSLVQPQTCTCIAEQN